MTVRPKRSGLSCMPRVWEGEHAYVAKYACTGQCRVLQVDDLFCSQAPGPCEEPCTSGQVSLCPKTRHSTRLLPRSTCMPSIRGLEDSPNYYKPLNPKKFIKAPHFPACATKVPPSRNLNRQVASLSLGSRLVQEDWNA